MNPEAAKYERLWGEHGIYRSVAPGEQLADHFLELSNPAPSALVYDFGCGTGRGAARIAERCRVVGFDFAANCLDPDVKIEFRQHDLTKPLDCEVAEYGFCTDVLEHIPPEDVDRVLVNILMASRRLYLNISTVDDVCGALIGEPLHLTVRDPFWWHEKLTELGMRIDWSGLTENSVTFFGGLYMNGDDFAEKSMLNIEMEAARENVKRNLLLGLQSVSPHEAQETIVYLLAGGPSLSQYEEQIVEAGKAGTPIVCVNGTYNWLLERGIKPAAMVMVDARPMNRRFVERPVDTCKYFVCSQCDHELVASLPPERTWLWHSAESTLIQDVAEELDIGVEWFPVPGGSTVMLRALPLLVMLGFRNVEVFGWDSCLMDGAHHAYEQPENDSRVVVPMHLGGRKFLCHPWMALQAYEFQKIVQNLLARIDDFNMIVHGCGLIAAMIEHAAELAATEVESGS